MTCVGLFGDRIQPQTVLAALRQSGNKEAKVLDLVVLVFPLTILVFTAISMVSPAFGTSQLNNAGPHGLSKILYAFTSGTANNGSAFAGISANTLWYNTTIGMAMVCPTRLCKRL